jgi:hypothetical protein
MMSSENRFPLFGIMLWVAFLGKSAGAAGHRLDRPHGSLCASAHIQLIGDEQASMLGTDADSRDNDGIKQTLTAFLVCL